MVDKVHVYFVYHYFNCHQWMATFSYQNGLKMLDRQGTKPIEAGGIA
ncbi:hypothetical protein [Anoxybacillus sp. UARK-01]|nr:hypothetical protein [Anoxybacillus sp. UARK-01]